MIKGIIFDLDGVLVSTDEMHFQAWKRLAEELNIHDFSRKDNERQRGVSRMASLNVVLEKSEKTYTEEEKQALADRKNEYYKELLAAMDDSCVLKNVKPSLEELKNRGLKLAVGSASKNAPAILEKAGLLSYLDACSCGLDVSKSKPNPEVFLVAAKKLNLSPEECLVVEDAQAGVEAAHRGGMKALAVGPYYQSLGGDDSAPMLCEADWNAILDA